MASGRKLTYLGFGAVTAATLALGIGEKSGSEEAPVAVEMEAVETTDSKPTSSLAEMDREALRAEIRAYILEEPEIILEAFRILEQKRVVDEAQADIDLVEQNSDMIFDDGFSFVGGNPEGSITLVEFQDYRCGYCKRAHSEVQALVKEDGDIRVILKEFPILGPDSTRLSELAIATKISQGDEAYKRISDAFMTYAGPINDAAIERLAQSAQVDLTQSLAALEEPDVQKRIDATHELGRVLKISGTPTFVIGEKILRGFLPKDEMAEVVELSRKVSR